MSKLSFQELDIKMERGDKENPLYLVVHTHAHTTNIVAMWCIKKIFSCAFHNLSGCVAISTCRLKNKRLPDPWIDLKNLWVHLIKKHNCSGGSVWTPGCEGSALLRKAHVECREGEGKLPVRPGELGQLGLSGRPVPWAILAPTFSPSSCFSEIRGIQVVSHLLNQ